MNNKQVILLVIKQVILQVIDIKVFFYKVMHENIYAKI